MRQIHALLNRVSMKQLLCLGLCLATIGAADISSAFAKSSGGSSGRVSGYSTRRGTYVAPHHRTTPDRSKINNWSTRGNVNPYTGKRGTK